MCVCVLGQSPASLGNYPERVSHTHTGQIYLQTNTETVNIQMHKLKALINTHAHTVHITTYDVQ